MIKKVPEKEARPVRAAVFTSVAKTEEAVINLLAGGFTKDQITVICSDEGRQRHFAEFEHQEPAGANTEAAIATGASIGATLGALGAGAVGLAIGGLPLIVVGGIGLMAGGVWGSFVGAMMTRGFEKEAANFYDQEVARGNLLVTVEVQDAQAHPSLADAELILAASGAEPLPLPEG
jgi:hypothetical protein